MEPAVLALALVAGAVAAFNPCGFALLPAYLSLLVASGDGERGHTSAAARAVRFTTGMTTGFVVVFGAFALVVAPLALAVERWLPALTIVIGVALIGLGIWLLAGRSMVAPRLTGWGRAPSATWGSQVGYGVTFALASLSCTLAPFLAVTTSALRAGSLLGVAGAFVAYALGMGAVVGVLALAAATASTSLTTRLRRAAPVVARFSGALLLVAGAYVAWYGWFELRVLAGTSVDDPIVSAAVAVQGALSRGVLGLGVPAIAVAVAVVLTIALTVLVRGLRHRDSEQPADEESLR